MSRPSRSSRRDFLKGQAAADAVIDLVDHVANADGAAIADGVAGAGAESGNSGRPGAIPSYLVHVGRRAMACDFEIFLQAGQYPHGTQSALAALDLVDQLEAQLSVYREESELSELNRRAAAEPVAVERGLFLLIEHALRLHQDTSGAFDITSSPLSRAWGFFKREGRMPLEREIDEARRSVGSQHVQLNPQTTTVRFLRPGLEINLNSIGKGYALDRAAELLTEAGVLDFLIHGGQSSVRAVGKNVQSQLPEGGWRVGLRHPLRPERRLAEFQLCDQALGTSGAGTQFFHFQGKRFGHLIDPRSGYPSEGVLSATVLAPTAAEADALATAFYIMGHEQAVRYCEAHPQVAMVMVCPGEREGAIQIHTHGMDERNWRPHD